MKFHCDRCKTRYSIADERVRGKILKIRCKNCTAVITVREGMDSSAAGRTGAASSAAPKASRQVSRSGPAAAARAAAAAPAIPKDAARSAPSSALQGAFKDVMSPGRISPSDSFQAPATLDEEWYVSVDGDQSGPFSLHNAMEWVRQRSPDEELWCWNEDFDDWLPVEKVSHFRGLRARPPTATAPAVAPAGISAPSAPMAASASAGAAALAPVETTPKPLFDATMERVKRETASRQAIDVSPSNGEPVKHHDPVDDMVDDIDFDIGEASRIVKLPMLGLPHGDAAGAGIRPKAEDSDGGGGLPGVAKIGKGSGSVPNIGQAMAAHQVAERMSPLSDDVLDEANPDILHAKPRTHYGLLLIGGGVLIALAVVIAFIATSGDEEEGGAEPRADVYVQSVESTDFQFGSGTSGGTRNPGNPTTKPGNDTKAPDTKGSSKGSTRRRPRNGSKKVASGNGTTSKATGPKPRGEVVPTNSAEDLRNELSPSDISRVSRRYQMSTTRCYERALKKDPFLKVRKIDVVITVAPTGVVTSLRLSSHNGTLLGGCLQARIRKWAFPKSRKGITTQISIVFQSR